MKAEILRALKIEGTPPPGSVTVEQITTKKETFSSAHEAFNRKVEEGTEKELGSGALALLSIAGTAVGLRSIMHGFETGNLNEVSSGAISIGAGVYVAKLSINMFKDLAGIQEQINKLKKMDKFHNDFLKKKREGHSQIPQIPSTRNL